ncbi:hypothetical protein T11_7020 [Trichinella zimbabwensis]|uniref:Uncharacterized protein n=1 Tax=Trichinella zimbabwensis TaxID=268475 RepID=A0A0V1H2P8_9BILA|nr:hypothetical protein T11_7020 [Trichinella zimbabwensis]
MYGKLSLLFCQGSTLDVVGSNQFQKSQSFCDYNRGGVCIVINSLRSELRISFGAGYIDWIQLFCQ